MKRRHHRERDGEHAARPDSRYRDDAGSAVSLMDLALTGIVNGCPMAAEHLKQRISQVSVEDVTRVARGIQLDTVYFLRDEEGAHHA